MKFHQFPKNRFSKNPTKPYPFPPRATDREITGTMKGNIFRLFHGFRRTSTPFPGPEDLAAWVMDLSLKMKPALGSDEKLLSETWTRALAAAEFALDNYDPEHPTIVRGAEGGKTSHRPSLLMVKFRDLVKLGKLEGLSVPQQAEVIGCSDRSVQRLQKRHAAEVSVEATSAVEDRDLIDLPMEDPWDLEDEFLFHETRRAVLFTYVTPMDELGLQPVNFFDTFDTFDSFDSFDTFDREAYAEEQAAMHREDIVVGIDFSLDEPSEEAEDLAQVLFLDDYRKPTREPDDGVLALLTAAMDAEFGFAPDVGMGRC